MDGRVRDRENGQGIDGRVVRTRLDAGCRASGPRLQAFGYVLTLQVRTVGSGESLGNALQRP